MRLRHLFFCMLVLLVAAPAGALAAGWSSVGGGAARAGHDPFDHGATTNVIGTWSQTATAEQDIEAGPVISDGVPGAQRVVYGTGADGLHVQMLSNGMEVGPQPGHDIDDGALDSDTFGVGTEIISPVIASSPSAPGQVYALHNDDDQGAGIDDIALAQVDLATGDIQQDVPVPDTSGYDLQSSPVITEPDAGGDASMFFVAANGSARALFRLDIDDVQSAGAVVAANSSSMFVPAATTQASPALVYLRDAVGTPTLYVALGSNGVNSLETYAAADFSPGPQGDAVGSGQTPSVALTSDGLIPGAPGSGMETSPWIYMATIDSVFNRVYRMEQTGSSQTLDVVPSDFLDGVPARGLAVSKRVGADPAEGVVAYTTDTDLYLLRTDDLSLKAEFDTSGGFVDFGSTIPALTDDLVFAMLGDGTQKVLRTSDAGEVSPSGFTEDPANGLSASAKGQPALGGGQVIFPSDIGAFAYSTRDGTPPRVGNVGPPSVLGGGVLEANAADARGIRDVEFRVDGTPVATSTNPVSGLSHTPSGGRFIAGWDAGGTDPGEHTLEAVATDNSGQVSSAKATIVVQPHTFDDTDPPETTIEAGPRRRTSDTTPRFRFSSSERPEAFQCSLDGRRFRSCPARHQIALVAGHHRLRVRAIDAAGNVDPTPSVRTFTVLAPGAVEVAPLRPIELNRRGQAAVPVTCHSRRRCRGLLILEALVPRSQAGSIRAAPARKGRKLRVGKRRFSVGARTRRKVLVRVSTTGRRLIRRNGKLKTLARVRLDTPTGVQRSNWPLTLTARDD